MEPAFPRRSVSILFRIVLSLYVLAAVGYLFWKAPAEQWDLRVYTLSARAFQLGENPYVQETLSNLAGEDLELPFVNPPLVLWGLLPLAHVDEATGHYAYLALKVAALVCLLALWRLCFLKAVDFDLFLLVSLLGFHGAIAMDLRSGNLSLFEQLGLWVALALFLRGRDFSFAIAIATVSTLKLTPLFFLGLLLAGEKPRKWRAALLSCGLFAGYIGLNYLLYPDLFVSFLENMQRMRMDPDNRGINNPTLFSLVSVIFGETEPGRVVAITLSLVVLGVSIWVRERYTAGEGDRLEAVLLMASVYLLVLPRLNVYSYVLAIPPLCYALSRIPDRRVGWAVGGSVCLLGTQPLYLPGGSRIAMGVWGHYSVWVNLLVWVVLIWALRRGDTGSNAQLSD